MTCDPSPRSSVKERQPNVPAEWVNPTEQIRRLTERARSIDEASAGLVTYYNSNPGYMVNAVWDQVSNNFSRLDTDAPAFWLDFSNGNLVPGSDQYGVTLWVADTDVAQPFTEINSVDGWQKIAQWNADGSQEGVPYELAAFIPDTLSASQVMFAHEFLEDVSFAQNLAGRAAAETASTGTATIDVQKNGASIGSLVYTTSTTGVFAVDATDFVTGDVLKFVGPSSADSTLAGVRLTIEGTRG